MTIHQFQLFQHEQILQKVPVSHDPGTDDSPSYNYISIEDVQDFFETATRFVLDGNPIPFLKDSKGERLKPWRIVFHPDKIIDVITNKPDSSNAVVRSIRGLESRSSQDITLSSQYSVSSLNAKIMARLSDIQKGESILTQRIRDLERRATEDKFKKIEILQDFNQIQDDIQNLLIESRRDDDLMIRMQHESRERDDFRLRIQMEDREKDEMIMQLHEQLQESQQQTLDRLARFRRYTDAILVQHLELHEYPIPRLFIVLPADQSQWNPLNILENEFRLYFICEYGNHTNDGINNIQNHIHVVKQHKGYGIQNPIEFYRIYGQYIFILLHALKSQGETRKSITFTPTVHTLNTSNTGIEHAISYMKALSAEEPCLKNISTFDEYEPPKEEDLWNLDRFLQTDNDEVRIHGNLYKLRVDSGHAKWVCLKHYRLIHDEKDQRAFENVVVKHGGSFDRRFGQVAIKPKSRAGANVFFDSLSGTSHVHDLDFKFDWDCTKKDLRDFRIALEASGVSTLRLDLSRFKSRIITKWFPFPSRYEMIFRIIELNNMKVLHFVLPDDLKKYSKLQSKESPHLFRLTYEVASHPIAAHPSFEFESVLDPNYTTASFDQRILQLSDIETVVLTETPNPQEFKKEGPTTLPDILKIRPNTLNSGLDSIWNGVVTLSEALKISRTFITIGSKDNSNDEELAKLQELANFVANMTSLDLKNHLIGDSGAFILSKALWNNANLTTLDLRWSQIKKEGAIAISQALRGNNTLTKLELSYNSIMKEGATALSRALKNNHSLTILGLGHNSIGNGGAIGISDMLKSNTTLETLDLRGNLIDKRGVIALAESLKNNNTLVNLNLKNNMIDKEGTAALSESLKTNTSLKRLIVEYNLVGNEEIIALVGDEEVLDDDTGQDTLEIEDGEEL